MVKNVIIGLLVVVILVLGSALVRVENQRYAMATGSCQNTNGGTFPDQECLAHFQSRAGWWWHLYYAVLDK
jgi:hypothetical protein